VTDASSPLADVPAVVSSRGPLHGLVVADFSRVLAGPLATMVLADLGADVIKVERPGVGDDTRAWGPPWRGSDSTYSLAVNRNKRSVTLDLAAPDDRRLAARLADRADVLIENFRPGGAARLGLGYDELAVRNPGLVYASITGFGAAESAAGLGGYDFLIQAVSGLMSVTGASDGEPHKVGVALVDVVTGLYTAIGIQAALAERAVSGEGQQVHVSLFGAAMASLVNQASAYLGAGVVPGRLGNRHPSITPYETLPAADRPIALAVGSDRLFQRLVTTLGLPELASDPRFAGNADRVAHRDDLAELLSGPLRGRPAAEWVELLRAEGIPAGVVNDVAEAFAEAEVLGLDPVVHATRGDGECIPTVRSPIELSRTPTVVRSAPPSLGEHDHEIRRWLEEGET
jgi:crotonobetainyl-CoA:carnitine CoA-transferase CaiB-like acyl-CoA transferase